MQQTPAVTATRLRDRLLIRETVIVAGIAVALPLLIHLIPAQTVPWGARLLPMFYAPLLGVVLFRLHVGLIPAAIAPLLNMALTGAPAPPLVAILTLELVTFTAVAYLLIHRFPGLWVAGPLAYVTAKMASVSAIAVVPLFAPFRPAVRFALSSIETAVPGLLLLTAVTVLALQLRSRNRTLSL